MVEYDVFLSFSSKDEDLAKPIWKELSSSGLRVFWSDESLKSEIGQSFFTVIQNSLIQSEHFVLVSTPNAWKSNWVKEEYETFFSNCYVPSKRERRLIIYEAITTDPSEHPAF